MSPHPPNNQYYSLDFDQSCFFLFQDMIEPVKTHMCCLPVVVATYLCSYINVVSSAKKVKVRQLLQRLMVPVSPDVGKKYYGER